MIQVNWRVEGMIGIYKEGMHEVKKIPKKIIQQKLENESKEFQKKLEFESKEFQKELKFESKELQQELKIFSGILPMISTIGLGSRKQKKMDLYMTMTSFGRKTPEISILNNYLLYNMLKELIE